MRYLIFVAIIVLNNNGAIAQSDYYWYKTQKITLNKLESRKFLLLSSPNDTQSIFKTFDSLKVETKTLKYSKIAQHLVFDKWENLGKNTFWAIIENKEKKAIKKTTKNRVILYESPFYTSKWGDTIAISHLFYVKLKNLSQADTLRKLARKQHLDVLGQNRFMPLWFTLACTKKSKGNALEMANWFYETSLFVASQPNFMTKQKTTGYCNNLIDPLFSNQWNLKNTGQYSGTSGIDINACDAWDITTCNPSIVVAVIDGGVQLDHPDLTNIFHSSYDGMTNKARSNLYTDHGTHVAGIIGAEHNSIGISGIAPECQIMSISHFFDHPQYIHTPDASQTLANSLAFAYHCGADVITCPFGIEGGFLPGTNPLLEDAITEALINGRCGLGTVIVFSSGNSGGTACNGGIYYPQNSIPDIIVVGAIDNNGNRWQSYSDTCDLTSSYGNEIDVVAPGYMIHTTDLSGSAGVPGDYTTFDATSSAAPHVAGIAALILSKNPCLTQSQVTSIIESTSQKLSGYSYYGSKPNGSWNIKIGHGLVDAYSALNNTPAPSGSCSNSSTVYLQNKNYNGIEAEEYGCELEIENVNNLNNSVVSYKFLNEAIIISDFEVELGSEIFIGNCCN